MTSGEPKPKERTDPARGDEAAPQRPRAAGGGPGAAEQDDPREEEGWSQPESSAQKGVPPDQG